MSPADTPEYVCARCAAAGKTCCSLGGGTLPGPQAGPKPAGPGSEPECFPVSAAERRRIETALANTRAPAAEFFTLRPNSREFLSSMCSLFPGREEVLLARYREGESHLSMKLDAAGNCLMLSECGCVLPEQARPWFCRIFPFWVIRGNLRCFGPEECLAVRESRNMRQLLRAFGQDQPGVFFCMENCAAIGNSTEPSRWSRPRGAVRAWVRPSGPGRR